MASEVRGWEFIAETAGAYPAVNMESGFLTVGSFAGETGAERNRIARLIAAAPALLEACKKAKKLLEPELVKEPDRTIFWELVDAIKKATGRVS